MSTQNNLSLQGEVALVTGASRGIGRACAIALAKAGAEVIVNFVQNEAKALSVCEEITAAGGKARISRFDVADVDTTQSTVEALIKEVGKISILVNNAGISRDGLLLRYSAEEWDQTLNTNLRGAFTTSQTVARSMLKQRRGSIIHISSVIALMGNAGQVAYAAAKAGLLGLTKSMAKELAGRNIRVNAIAPGYVDTDMTSEMSAEMKEALLKSIPLGRVGTSEEIADAVVYLASPASSYVTGQVLVVDGGLVM